MRFNHLFLGIPTCLFTVLSQLAFGQEQCLSEKIADQNAQRFPLLAEARAELRAAISENAKSIEENFPGERSVVTIPVVVHVVYKGGTENISSDQINSQIEVLNADFRKTNGNAAAVPSEFAPFLADLEIEFCLASLDPAGNPTTGVTRRATTWDNVADTYLPDGRPRVCYTALGGTDAWDSKRYLNIWVAKIGGGVLGYATFPGTAPQTEDGVFVDPRYFGKTGLALLYPPHHLGRTCTHEVGHYFDLYHIWGNNANTCDDDDGVGDTPKQRAAYDGCPTHPQYSCGNKAMFMNFMDYTVDGCLSMFTQGQKSRVWAALQMVRPGLMSSNGCGTVSSSEPIDNQRIRVFPNPASEYLTLHFPENFDVPDKVFLTDVLGKTRPMEIISKSAEGLILDVSNLPPGCYFVQVSEGRRAVFVIK